MRTSGRGDRLHDKRSIMFSGLSSTPIATNLNQSLIARADLCHSSWRPRSAYQRPRAELDQPPALRIPADDRRPRPGTILSRRYKGRTLEVEVLDHGFAYDGQVYRSLSAVAQVITGTHCSGYFFFGLTQRGTKP